MISSLGLLLCALAVGACGGGDGSDLATASTAGIDGEGEATTLASPAVSETGTSEPDASSSTSTILATSAKPLAISFSLLADRSTSAGVFAGDGTLVRTLWRGERIRAGTVVRSWDRRDDRGVKVPDGDYTVKVVHHDVRHVWEGVVGNTSSSGGENTLHRSFQVPTSLAAAAGRVHVAVGYNEAQSAIHGFELTRPQVPSSPISLTDPFISASMVAVDGERLYWTNIGGMAKKSFVAAYELATGAQVVFPAGRPLCLNLMADGSTCYAFQTYRSVLDFHDTLDSPPTGLAVQRDGRLLAVAYGREGRIRLFDKTSGELLRTLEVRLAAGASNQIAFEPGGDLWVIAEASTQRYTALESSSPRVAASINSLVKPLAVTVDPKDGASVWVADGGASQQLKRFDSGGTLLNTIGRKGGCTTTADVSYQRLCFMTSPGNEAAALTVDDERAVWVVDSGNNRMLRVGRDGRVDSQIAYLPAVYVSAVDAGQPSRVFANFLEYEVDYAKPLSDPTSWRLVRNWLPTLPAALQDIDSANRAFGGFRTVQTLSNGRTYAMLNVGAGQSLVELTAGGRMRLSTTLPVPGNGETSVVLYKKGDLRYARTEAGRQTVLRLPLQGFDSAGNPIWPAEPTVFASVPTNDANLPYHRTGTFSGVVGPRFPSTSTGKVVFFNASVEAQSGFHLGATARYGSTWNWQASPSGPLDGLGSFQTRKDDPAIHYGGNTVMAVGRSIVYGYHGEFYTDLGNRRVGQANQFMHFRDDGLFIGQFGVPSTRATSPVQPGLSGNAFSPTLVRVNKRTYLYHNDESSHGGIHRWQLEGLDDIQEIVGKATPKSRTLTLR